MCINVSWNNVTPSLGCRQEKGLMYAQKNTKLARTNLNGGLPQVGRDTITSPLLK